MSALLCGYIWLVATIYMNGTREPFPAIAIAMLMGIIVTVGVSMRIASRRKILEQRYAMLYGAVPPTGDLKGTRYGGAAGILAGSYVAGAVIGMVVDAFREANQRTEVTSEQLRMLNEIRLARMDPAAGVLLCFGFALLASAIAASI